jgi:myo-inositol-1-phosphate synthase
MEEIRVAIAGVGNVASALVQGVAYYRNCEEESIPGVMHPVLGGYHIGSIKFVAAFDVNKNKVGEDLARAIFVKPNCALKTADVPLTGVKVQKGPVLDGIGRYLREKIPVDDRQHPVDVEKVLRKSKADVLVILVPVGSDRAARYYAECALNAGVAVVNGMPALIANNQEFIALAEKKRVPVIGDDVKSQVGATITHRALIEMMVNRGVKIHNTYQLNIGGDMDFYNMLERERLLTKKITKTEAVTSLVPYEMPTHIGPSDYVEFLNNTKIAFIRILASKFCDVPVSIEVKLEVQDAYNSAGILVDTIRCSKIARDRKLGGAIIPASAYYMKKPPMQMPDAQAKAELEKFINQK